MKKEALEVLQEGIKHHPDNAELQYRITACLLTMGIKQEAMEHLHSALKLNYEMHNEMFEYIPALKENTSVIDVIQSYKK